MGGRPCYRGMAVLLQWAGGAAYNGCPGLLQGASGLSDDDVFSGDDAVSGDGWESER